MYDFPSYRQSAYVEGNKITRFCYVNNTFKNILSVSTMILFFQFRNMKHPTLNPLVFMLPCPGTSSLLLETRSSKLPWHGDVASLSIGHIVN